MARRWLPATSEEAELVGALAHLSALLSGGNFTIIDVPGSVSTMPLGINDAGEMVEFFGRAGEGNGFLLSEGSFTTIDVPGSVLTFAYGVNDAAQIVGVFTDPIGQHGFLFSGGNFTTIDVPGSDITSALGINDAGEIVGWFRDPTVRGRFGGFLRTPAATGVTPTTTGPWAAPSGQALTDALPLARLDHDTD